MMKLKTESIVMLREACEVIPGNIYPAKGGRKQGTDYWLVVAISGTAAHLIGFNDTGAPVSTASYNKSAMRERPIIGRCDLSSLILTATPDTKGSMADAAVGPCDCDPHIEHCPSCAPYLHEPLKPASQADQGTRN